MGAVVVLMAIGYMLLITMGGLLFTCIEKIPGASKDPKYKSFCQKKWISWLFPLDNPPHSGYNEGMRTGQLPYHADRYYDPYWTNWKKDEV